MYLCVCVCFFVGRQVSLCLSCLVEKRRAVNSVQYGERKEQLLKPRWDDVCSSHLKVFEGVLGFRLECLGHGVCLAACAADRNRWCTWNWDVGLNSPHLQIRLEVTHSRCPWLSAFKRYKFRVRSLRLWQKYTGPSHCMCSDVSILPVVGSLGNRSPEPTQNIALCFLSSDLLLEGTRSTKQSLTSDVQVMTPLVKAWCSSSESL